MKGTSHSYLIYEIPFDLSFSDQSISNDVRLTLHYHRIWSYLCRLPPVGLLKHYISPSSSRPQLLTGNPSPILSVVPTVDL